MRCPLLLHSRSNKCLFVIGSVSSLPRFSMVAILSLIGRLFFTLLRLLLLLFIFIWTVFSCEHKLKKEKRKKWLPSIFSNSSSSMLQRSDSHLPGSVSCPLQLKLALQLKNRTRMLYWGTQLAKSMAAAP